MPTQDSRHDSPARRGKGSQVVYGVGTHKSYRGQERQDEHVLRRALIAILVALAVAALVLGVAYLA